MSSENVIIILGEDTPIAVREEVARFSDGGLLTFSWDNEDNEDMPLLAEYLRIKYNTYHCVVM